MQVLKRNIIIFLLGGFIYGGIEIAFRGYTHWSMFIAGGLVGCILYTLYGYIGKGHLLLKGVLGCSVITTVEFIAGFITNILLDWSVWDYSDKFLNLFGQICLLFSVFWFFLSIPVSFFLDGVRRKFYQAGI